MDNSLTDFVKDNMTGANIGSETQTSMAGQTFIYDAIGDDAKLNEIEAECKPYVVVLIGFPSYGKTSFVSTCYQILLQNGKVGDYKFYDSDTFVGLERRVAARRFSKTNNVSQTKRTLRGEAHLLTFRFHAPQDEDRVIIFSDRSGENYADYVNKKDAIVSDKLIINADRLLFFVNCEDLIGRNFMNLKDDYSLLLENMKTNNVPFSEITIDLLYNKSDLIDDGNKVKFEKNKAELNNLFISILGENAFTEHKIVSNNIEQSRDIESLLLDIINYSSVKNSSLKDQTGKIDWVKNIILKG